MDLSKQGNGKSSLGRCLILVEALSKATIPLRFSEMKTLVSGLSDATLSRLLRSLEELSYAERIHREGYMPGVQLRRWSEEMRGAPEEFKRVARAQVEQLSASTQESSAVARLEGDFIRIIQSKTMPDAVSIIGEGALLHYEADHAASLAILQQMNSRERASAIRSPFSRIRNEDDYKRAIAIALSKDGLWVDRSRVRPGVCRLALGFCCQGNPAVVFLCTTVEVVNRNKSKLVSALGKAREAFMAQSWT